jgi:transposase-like protein
MAAEGTSPAEIATRLGVTVETVKNWVTRYRQSGLRGVTEQRNIGRRLAFPRSVIIRATLRPPATDLGANRWSSRSLARELGVGHATVARVWAEYGVAPRAYGAVLLTTDPTLVLRSVEIIGLFLEPTTPMVGVRSRSDRSRSQTRTQDDISEFLKTPSSPPLSIVSRSALARERSNFLGAMERAGGMGEVVVLSPTLDKRTPLVPVGGRGVRFHRVSSYPTWLNMLDVLHTMEHTRCAPEPGEPAQLPLLTISEEVSARISAIRRARGAVSWVRHQPRR